MAKHLCIFLNKVLTIYFATQYFLLTDENDKGFCDDNCSKEHRNGFCVRGQNENFCAFIRKAKKGKMKKKLF